jgi:VanZ family protein
VTPRAALWGAVIQAALIFGLSSRPGDAYPTVSVPGADKVVHFALYAPLGALLCHGFGGRAAWAAAGATLYGVTDELHQAFVPGRFPDVGDAVADGLGALAGALWMRRRRLRAATGAASAPP